MHQQTALPLRMQALMKSIIPPNILKIAPIVSLRKANAVPKVSIIIELSIDQAGLKTSNKNLTIG